MNNASIASVYDQIADVYANKNEDRGEVEGEIKKFANLMPQNARIVDLGCGVGFDSRDLKQLRPDLEILGIDSSTEMLKQFKQIAPGITFKKGDMLKVRINESSFDGIWLNAAFLHISKEKAKELLVKILEWLKPGGYLYIRTKEGKGEKVIPASKYGRSDLSRFFALYGKEELCRLLTENGFKIKELTTSKHKENWLIAIAQKSK